MALHDNPNRTATISTVAFEDLKPGDKFALQLHPNGLEAVGVCVCAPEVLEGKRRFVRRGRRVQRLDTYKARCIELHKYLGACEWNPEELAGTMVDLLEVPERS